MRETGPGGKIPLLTDQDNLYSREDPLNRLHDGTSHGDVPADPEKDVYVDPVSRSFTRVSVLTLTLLVALFGGAVWMGCSLWTTSVELPSSGGEVPEGKRPHQGDFTAMCDIDDDNHKFDCHPGPGASQAVCAERGCCWRGVQSEVNNTLGRSTNVPYCYFPTDYPSYVATGVEPTPYGYRARLENVRNASDWPGNLRELYLDVTEEEDNTLHFKIYDPKVVRYEVPIDTPKVTRKATHPQYVFLIKSRPFGFIVKRKATGAVIFDSTMAPLLYADQYLQLTTAVPSGFLYGLGEHRSAFRRNATDWHQMTLWARDQGPALNSNLYGVHPFFMSLEKDGSAYGVFLLNSNAMDVDVQPYPSLTFRTVGGVLDLYVFTGPSPAAVIQQYAAVIGRPAMPPYWALGFHLCRWGYNGTEGLQKVISRMRKGAFPYDAQWTDIDYMDRHLDWTYDKHKYSGLPSVVKDLHDHGQHYVIIVDPGISSLFPGKYPPYDTGLKQDVFVKDYKGKPIEGQVWPGPTVFPDFSKPETEDWWFSSAKSFHDQIPFDGLWTDMNEPSNFVYGSRSGCSNNSLDNPPYTPGITGGRLADKTLCPSAQHHLGTHYNLHSLYGHLEARASHRVLERLRGKRSLVITRSTFASTGRYAGHWTGDNTATWDALYYSIPVILRFQMFGIPLVGADVCGFSGDTTEELCTRWMQLGAFYPFMRNHNMLQAKAQDPASFSTEAQSRMRAALVQRYALLPHLYTLFYGAHRHGRAVLNALSFVYPLDATTYSIDQQFMWGDTLLISPVLQQGHTSVLAYLPQDTWYSLGSGARVLPTGQWVRLDAPLNTISVHVRGGSVIPQQHPLTATTTVKARENPFGFLVALDSKGEAKGSLYWDDGETINATESGEFIFIKLTVTPGLLTTEVVHAGYKPTTDMVLGEVTVMGLASRPTNVTLNQTSVQFEWNSEDKVLKVTNLKVTLTEPFTMKWIF